MFVMRMGRSSTLSRHPPRKAMAPTSSARREFNRSPCAAQVIRVNPSRFLWSETLEKPNNPAILHTEDAGGKSFRAQRPRLLTFVRLLLAGVSRNFPMTDPSPSPPPRPERGKTSHPAQQLATKNPPADHPQIPQPPPRHVPPPVVVDWLRIWRQGQPVIVQQRQLHH